MKKFKLTGAKLSCIKYRIKVDGGLKSLAHIMWKKKKFTWNEDMATFVQKFVQDV
jgi:hypothetical protein